MRVLNNKEIARLLAAADKIAKLVAPLEARIAALEAAAGAAPQNSAVAPLETRVARLEKVAAAIAAAGAAQ